MKPKKNKKANLENYRPIFLQIGTILTLSLVLLAFEWKSGVEIKDISIDNISWDDNEELTQVNIMPKVEVPEVKPPSFEIDIIENNDEFEEENFLDLISEIGEDDPIYIDDYVEDSEEVDEPFLSVQFMPTFQGKGVAYFRNYVMQNVKFPVNAAEMGITGKVYATFVVDKDGSIIDVQILRNVHPAIDKEVVRVIQNSPKWEPGMNDGIYVKVRFSIAIAFELQ